MFQQILFTFDFFFSFPSLALFFFKFKFTILAVVHTDFSCWGETHRSTLLYMYMGYIYVQWYVVIARYSAGKMSVAFKLNQLMWSWFDRLLTLSERIGGGVLFFFQ